MKDEFRSMNGGFVDPQATPIDKNLSKRTTAFAIRIVRLFVSLPKDPEIQVIGKQLLRSGTSVGAHYREAKRAKSEKDFLNKLQGALQELEETAYWLELLVEAELIAKVKLQLLQKEADELTAIFVTIVKKIKSK